MTTREAFTDEEWSLLMRVPALAGLAVAGSARGGTMRELLVLMKEIARGEGRFPDDQLIQAIATDEGTEWGSDGAANMRSEHRSFEEIEGEVLSACRDAAAVLARKATADEAEHYRALVVGVAQRVAEAAKEGDVLGIGGTRVSEGERRTIEAVEEALRAPGSAT